MPKKVESFLKRWTQSKCAKREEPYLSDQTADAPRVGRITPWILLLMCMCFVAANWFDGRAFSFMKSFYSTPLEFNAPIGQPDRIQYFDFLDNAAAGYPVFLDLVEAILGSPMAALKVQLILLGIAILFLSWSTFRVFGSPYLAITLALLVFGLCSLIRFDAQIMTEALFLGLVCSMLGVMNLLVASPSVRLIVIGGLLCGLAIAVRPAGYSMLPIWPILLWMIWNRYDGRKWKLVVALAAPLTLCALAESAIWHHSHDGSMGRTTPANLHFFAKMLMADSEPVLKEQYAHDRDVRNFVSEMRGIAEPFRVTVMYAPNWHSRAILLEQLEIKSEIQTLFRSTKLATMKGLEWRTNSAGQLNPILGEIGLFSLLHTPKDWLVNAWTHYYALWRNYRIYDLEMTKIHTSYVRQMVGEFGESLARNPTAFASLRPKLNWAVRSNEIFSIISFIISFMALGCTAWKSGKDGALQLDNALAMSAISALLVHGHYIMIGLFGAAQMRYAVVMWTFQVCCGLLFLYWLAGYLRRTRLVASAPSAQKASPKI